MSAPELERHRARLAAITPRIERLVVAPAEVRDALGWLAGPVLRRAGWQPRIATRALRALLSAVGEAAGEVDLRRVRDALAELEGNVRVVERATVVHGRPPVGHVTWLERLVSLLDGALGCITHEEDVRVARALASPDALRLELPFGPDEPALARAACVADVLLEAARAEIDLDVRRRLLLEAARSVLLDASTRLHRTPAPIGARLAHVARELARSERLAACGVDPGRSALSQAREALARGQGERVRACVVALDAIARRTADRELARLTGRAIEELAALEPDPAARTQRDGTHGRSDTLAQARARFGAPLIDAVASGLARGRAQLSERSAQEDPDAPLPALERRAREVRDEAAYELFAAMLSVGALFDVASGVVPVRIVEEARASKIVAHPTAELELVQATRVEDVPHALLTDPRAITFQLAEGTLLARRFRADEHARHARTRLSSEARVYVLDGSSSMLGPRARMRDALLLSELASLLRRLDDPERHLSPVLRFRYFDRALGTEVTVRARDEALAAVAEVLGTVRTGGTNIQAALLGALASVRALLDEGEPLERAQIVLVTDGRARVDPASIEAARARIEGLPLRIGVIALGEESPALRALAATQRAAGLDVLYHFVPDAELERVLEGEHALPIPLHSTRDETASMLGEGLGALLDEMDALSRSRDLEARRALAGFASALDDVGLSKDALSDAERARLALLHRDERALAARFARWFAPSSTELAPGAGGAPGPLEAESLERVRTVLASVAEVLLLLPPTHGTSRRVEAIELAERLLAEHAIPPWQYAQIVRAHAGALAAELDAIRHAARE